MPAIFSKAPAKTILFGEHAVVYGQPAIAIPITDLYSKVSVISNAVGSSNEVRIIAPEIKLNKLISDLPRNDYFVSTIQMVMDYLRIDHYPACEVRISSTIPIASGLGSSAALAVSLLRALFYFLGTSPEDHVISDLAFQLEKISHGDPSGIDNSVIAYEKPIYYVREKPVELLKVGRAFTIIIGNSGIIGSTKVAVAGVRERYQSNPTKFEYLFQRIGAISNEARVNIESGNIDIIGEKMIENHKLLQELGVSCPELDKLVAAGINAGAIGAKLCGGGLGGNIIALVPENAATQIADALLSAGAVKTYVTIIKPN